MGTRGSLDKAGDQVGDHILQQEEKALPWEDVERLPEMPWNPLFQQKTTTRPVLTAGGWLNLKCPRYFSKVSGLIFSYSKYGAWTSSTSITWELVRSTKLLSHSNLLKHHLRF